MAELLGKFPKEVAEHCTIDDLNLWVAYSKLKADNEEKAAKKARKKHNA